MYQIIKYDTGDVIGVTDAVNYIKRNPASGCLIPCSPDDATGIAYHGAVYNLLGHTELHKAETVLVTDYDVQTLIAANIALRQRVVSAENALCEQEILLTGQLSAVEDALCAAEIAADKY